MTWLVGLLIGGCASSPPAPRSTRSERPASPADAGRATDTPANTPAAEPADDIEDESVAETPVAAFQTAVRRLDEGDGVGCLRHLDRVLALDPRWGENTSFQRTRLRCLIQAGLCEERDGQLECE